MDGSRRSPTWAVALGGVFAALAIVVMGLGTWIPGTGYLCPIICMVMVQVILKSCGTRIAWAWYGSVALLSALVASDKEAAAVFLFLGYYPILKPRIDRKKLRLLWKLLFFNTSFLAVTWLSTKLLGVELVEEAFADVRAVILFALLFLSNLTFFLLDRLLNLFPGKFGKQQ